MYNRYIPSDTNYAKVEPESTPAQPQKKPPPVGAQVHHSPPHENKKSTPTQSFLGGVGVPLPQFLKGKEGLAALFTQGEGKGLTSLLKSLHLENIDTGDILLLLIMLFLLAEGDDLELVIALGLVLIMGLGDKEKEKEDT